LTSLFRRSSEDMRLRLHWNSFLIS